MDGNGKCQNQPRFGCANGSLWDTKLQEVIIVDIRSRIARRKNDGNEIADVMTSEHLLKQVISFAK